MRRRRMNLILVRAAIKLASRPKKLRASSSPRVDFPGLIALRLPAKAARAIADVRERFFDCGRRISIELMRCNGPSNPKGPRRSRAFVTGR